MLYNPRNSFFHKEVTYSLADQQNSGHCLFREGPGSCSATTFPSTNSLGLKHQPFVPASQTTTFIYRWHNMKRLSDVAQEGKIGLASQAFRISLHLVLVSVSSLFGDNELLSEYDTKCGYFILEKTACKFKTILKIMLMGKWTLLCTLGETLRVSRTPLIDCYSL